MAVTGQDKGSQTASIAVTGYPQINKCIFMSVLHLLTLSGRFRVGFGVGDISNTIEH